MYFISIDMNIETITIFIALKLFTTNRVKCFPKKEKLFSEKCKYPKKYEYIDNIKEKTTTDLFFLIKEG